MNYLHDNPVGYRIRRLARYLGDDTDAALARRLGVSSQVLNRAINRGELSRKLADRLRALIPGLTRDWIYDGDLGGLPLHLAQALGGPPDTNFTTRP